MMGYYKDPETTSRCFTEDGFFRTGDLVTMDAEGQVRIIGRIKEQFKTSKGKYVAPAPIESRLCGHPAVEGCCLMGSGMPSAFGLIVLTADARRQCATQQGKLAMERSLREQLDTVNAGLDSHERVSFLAIADGPWTISSGVMTPTLKLKRSALEARYQQFFDTWSSSGKAVIWESDPVIGSDAPAGVASQVGQ
jgi:long-chain acyl-CoA synthetase